MRRNTLCKQNNFSLIILRALLFLLAGKSSLIYAAADTATITITGKVLANTCTIDSGSANQSITLPDITARELRGKGTTAGEKLVRITLTDCETVNRVVVKAFGQEDVDDPVAFKNALADGSRGVGIYFYQTDGITKFRPDGSIQQTSALLPLPVNVLDYKVSYVATKETVEAGGFRSVVSMTFDYQ
ncbi:fimbrial protein [Leclercia sp. UBA5958]|uniref:fimbrial protein n=1 Tax=Leclercia sp. UBA5958 TaxID=1946742 RepID=UPI00257BD5F9|nr:fimbrial protein [Leclercia sp. UBA5958]